MSIMMVAGALPALEDAVAKQQLLRPWRQRLIMTAFKNSPSDLGSFTMAPMDTFTSCCGIVLANGLGNISTRTLFRPTCGGRCYYDGQRLGHVLSAAIMVGGDDPANFYGSDGYGSLKASNLALWPTQALTIGSATDSGVCNNMHIRRSQTCDWVSIDKRSQD